MESGASDEAVKPWLVGINRSVFRSRGARTQPTVPRASGRPLRSLGPQDGSLRAPRSCRPPGLKGAWSGLPPGVPRGPGAVQRLPRCRPGAAGRGRPSRGFRGHLTSCVTGTGFALVPPRLKVTREGNVLPTRPLRCIVTPPTPTFNHKRGHWLAYIKGRDERPTLSLLPVGPGTCWVLGRGRGSRW